MKLKQLQSLLQDVEPFEEPKIELEQYPTGAHLASQFLFAVESKFEELDGCSVLDLGCGTGMLSIGSAIMGASNVIGVDLDGDALDVARRNMSQYEDGLPIDLILCDVRQIAAQSRLMADTVVMNPPFGTRRKGADLEFLDAAFKLSRNAIYSLHKTSTRGHIEKVALRQFMAASAEVVAELRYDLPATYKFHKLFPDLDSLHPLRPGRSPRTYRWTSGALRFQIRSAPRAKGKTFAVETPGLADIFLSADHPNMTFNKQTW